MSATSGNLNGVATIFTSDIYESILKKNAKDKDLIKVARIVTIVAGVLMIFFAHIVSALGSAVDAYYTIIVIMDMPLFIIAVVYGLLWKRANWQGAITGYIVAAVCGAVARFGFGLENNSTAFLTAGVSLLVTPIISFLTHKPDEDKVSSIWKAKKTSQEEIDRNDVFNIIPKTLPGKISLGALAGGFVIFIIGILMGSTGHPLASVVAISGMVIYFIAGLARTSTN